MNAILREFGKNADILPLEYLSIKTDSPVGKFTSENLGNPLLSDCRVIGKCNVQQILRTLNPKHIVINAI